MSPEEVAGYCPMGCGQTLFLADGGFVTCSYPTCPLPGAVSVILGEDDLEHVVDFGHAGFTVLHPLRERLDPGLLGCLLGERLPGLNGPPVRPGRYRVREACPGLLTYEALS